MKIWLSSPLLQYERSVFLKSPPSVNRWNRFACQHPHSRPLYRVSERSVAVVRMPDVKNEPDWSPYGLRRPACTLFRSVRFRSGTFKPSGLLVRMFRTMSSVMGNGNPASPENCSDFNSMPRVGSRVSMSEAGSSGPVMARSRPHDRLTLKLSARSDERVTWWFQFRTASRCQVCCPVYRAGSAMSVPG